MKASEQERPPNIFQMARRKLAARLSECPVQVIDIEPHKLSVVSAFSDLTPQGFAVVDGGAHPLLSAKELPKRPVHDVVSLRAKVMRQSFDFSQVTTHHGLPDELVGQCSKLEIEQSPSPLSNRLRLMPTDLGAGRVVTIISPGPAVFRQANVTRPRKLGSADRRVLVPGVKIPKVRSMPARIASQVPLVRRREPIIKSAAGRPSATMTHDMALLRAASGEPDADIQLIGVYCNVPIAAATSLEFDPSTGALMLSIRENASSIITAAKRPVVTLILGKVTATGKMVRAFRP